MPLFYLSLAFLIGIAVGPFLNQPASRLFLLAALCLLISWALACLIGARWQVVHRFKGLLTRFNLSPDAIPATAIRLLPGLMLVSGLLGAGHYAVRQPDFANPAFIGHHNDSGERVTLTGILIEPPDERDTYSNLRVEVEALRPANGVLHSTVHGRVLAGVPSGGDFAYGDRLVISGHLATPPQDELFSYRSYLAGQGIYSYLSFAEAALLESGQGSPIGQTIFALQHHAQTILYQLFPDPEASLLSGILLGIETGISPDLKDKFRDTGTSHIIAISGFNITILGAIFTARFSRILGERGGALMAIVAIGLCTLLVGADAAVVRAALMGALVIIARRLRRGQAALNTLALVAALMAYHNPLVLNDPGFQLSFAATLGLVLYAEPLSELFRRQALVYLRISTVEKITPPISEFVLLTFAAQLTTLPVVIYHFERLSLSSFLVNPLVLPVQSAIMILGGLAVLAGLVWMPLCALLSLPVWTLTAYTIRVVEYFGQYRAGVLVLGPLSGTGIAGLSALLLTATRALRTPPPARRYDHHILSGLRWLATPLTLAVLIGLGAIIWRQALAQPDGNLHVSLLDVEGGEAVYIQSPSGLRLLINGGVSTVRLSEALGRRMPLGTGGLDALIIASADQDSLSALPRLVERFPPELVLWSGLPTASRAAGQLAETLLNLDLTMTPAEAGQSLDLGGDAWLDVLSAGKRGAVLLLRWGEFRMLMPIGATFEDLEGWRMGADMGPVSTLLLADSGHQASNPVEWLARLRPQVVLLSVDAGNQDGLPHTEVLEALEGYNLLRTDRDGWIQLSTDGEQLWVQVQD